MTASDYKRAMSDKPDPFGAPFGTLFGDHMSVAQYDEGEYTYDGPQPLENFSLHPATHVLHYASECFEGLKAHRQVDGSVAIFRLEDSVQRMLLSIAKLRMKPPSADLLHPRRNHCNDCTGCNRHWRYSSLKESMRFVLPDLHRISK